MWIINIIIYVLFVVSLIILSYIDWKTYEISPSLIKFILILGILNIIINIDKYWYYLLGFFSASTILFVIYIITKGKAIGGGDIKLMAVAGLFLGFDRAVLALFTGCIFASVIQVARMKLSRAGDVFALGPYLSAGILLALLVGKEIIKWYFTI